MRLATRISPQQLTFAQEFFLIFSTSTKNADMPRGQPSIDDDDNNYLSSSMPLLLGGASAVNKINCVFQLS